MTSSTTQKQPRGKQTGTGVSGITEETEDAAKFKRVLSTCKQLCDGPPAQYQLPVTEAKSSAKYQIRQLVHGTPEMFTPAYTVLLVGETGSGKTTMVDGMVNYIYGVTLKHDFRLRLRDESLDNQDQVSSLTKGVTCYTIHPNPHTRFNFTLNIIDTPGFGDTDGVQWDKVAMKQMEELFLMSGKYDVDSLSSVCLVTKSDLNRLTIGTKYVIDKTLEMFSKEMIPNLCVMGTHHSTSEIVLSVLRDHNVPFQDKFFFNNSWLTTNATSAMNVELFQNFTASCETFFTKLLRGIPCNPKLCASVMKERVLLKEDAQVLMGLMRDHVYQIFWLKDKDEVIRKLKPKQISLRVKRLKKSLTRNQCCPTCQVVCLSNVGRFKAFQNLFAGSSRCSKCKCLIEIHLVCFSKYEAGTKTERIAFEDLSRFDKVLDDNKQEREEKEASIATAFHKLQSHIQRLNKIALKPIAESENSFFELLIKEEKQQKTIGYEARICELERLETSVALKEIAANEDGTVDKLINAWQS